MGAAASGVGKAYCCLLYSCEKPAGNQGACDWPTSSWRHGRPRLCPCADRVATYPQQCGTNLLVGHYHGVLDVAIPNTSNKVPHRPSSNIQPP